MVHILALDQGTTSSRGIIFDTTMQVVAIAQEEFAQHYPASGWVEHDPHTLWTTIVATARAAIEKSGIEPADIAAIGITNQRETTLVWDRETGEPVCNAIVWQDRRTAPLCGKLKSDNHEAMITARTGLLLDPYFSATKLSWILDNVEGARARAKAGELVFGTVDTWLIWKLTDGRVHATDATNAARTMLYDIHKGRWSQTICDLLEIPMQMLPEVRDCAADFGHTRADLFGCPIPILGVAGDQQASTIGQACFKPGMVKSTYGTGCFAVLNTGATPVASSRRLLTTVAYQLDGKPTYALEGSIFIAGAVVQWLRDALGIIDSAPDTLEMAMRADPNQDLILVPAFVGLGAPYWQPDARGAVFGLSRNSGPAEFARAALESVGFQTRDLLESMKADWTHQPNQPSLRVDGGMAANDFAMQFLSDITGAPVDRPRILETTALGAAWLAGHRAGVWPGISEFATGWIRERQFTPNMSVSDRDARYARWRQAIDAVLNVN